MHNKVYLILELLKYSMLSDFGNCRPFPANMGDPLNTKCGFQIMFVINLRDFFPNLAFLPL